MNAQPLTKFIIERHRIYERRQSGRLAPWTTDPILQRYRFCNVYRELDTVTKWIADNWRTPNADSPNLWFAMAMARLINWPDTLTTMAFPGGKWRPQWFIDALHARKQAGMKVFSGAYIVSTNGVQMDKAEYLAHHVLTPMWEARAILAPRKGDSLFQFAARLQTAHGFKGFMAGQVVADLKHALPAPMSGKHPNPLTGASDWWEWSVPGPGSTRGLNRVVDRDLNKTWNDTDWRDTMHALRHKVNASIERQNMQALHAQDLQNCLCEFDKYERARLGQGRPRSTYPGTK